MLWIGTGKTALVLASILVAAPLGSCNDTGSDEEDFIYADYSDVDMSVANSCRPELPAQAYR